MNIDTVLFLKIEAPNYSSAAIDRGFRENGIEVHSINWQQEKFNFGLHGLKGITLVRVRNMQPAPPDVIFIHANTPSPAHHPSILDREFITELRKYSFVINYTFDVRKNIDCHINIAPITDLILFSNKTDVKKMNEMGFRNVDYLQCSADYGLFHSVPREVLENNHNILFIGNNFVNTQLDFPLSMERKEMVDFLYKNYPRDFKAYGMGWSTRIINTPEDQRMLYNNCKIAICHNQFDYECYTSDRLFRAMGCGAFCITKHFEGIETMFEVSKHLATYRTLDELKIKIDYYLEHDAEREQIAKAGHEHVLANHTWTNRIAELKLLIHGRVSNAEKSESKV
jgi:spore maturation protein CgeB